MQSIRLRGRISPLWRSGWQSPDYLLLPKPSHCISEWSFVDFYSIIREGDELGWDATWMGEETCSEVLERATRNLEYWAKASDLFRKMYVDDQELIRTAEANKLRWASMVKDIQNQLEIS